MTDRLADKKSMAALVTGAGRRIGRALAVSLARAGHDVYLHYHGAEAEIASLSDEIAGLGRKSYAVKADLADATQVTSLIARCTELGPIMCLVNNAALYEPDAALDLSVQTLDAHYAVNLRAPLLLAQAFARQAPPDSLMVNLLDFHVAATTPAFFSYGVSKAGLAAATEMLAIALAPAIRVCAIAPGLVLPSPSESGERFDRLRRDTLLQRGPDIPDIVAAFEYLLAARAVTGQILYVDSGQRLISKRKPHV